MRPGRIELPSHPWQGRILPLNYGRRLLIGTTIGTEEIIQNAPQRASLLPCFVFHSCYLSLQSYNADARLSVDMFPVKPIFASRKAHNDDAPVVKWISLRSSEPSFQVRVLAGAHYENTIRHSLMVFS